MTNSNPPNVNNKKPYVNSMTTPTSINEILNKHAKDWIECLENEDYEKASDVKKQTSTALYTLIASVRPKNMTEKDAKKLVAENVIGAGKPELERYALVVSRAMGHNQALQDYDNAIKEALK